MAHLSFNLVSPEKVLLDKEVSMVVIPGIEGDIGVLPNHAPLTHPLASRGRYRI